ncbi:SNF2 helicase associated domain-containing protein [Brevibacillus borstelensis]|uniref:DEAD/DEAH box helicase n=1 Tax=Brevibacillus borstelensis TaxID=45462 RepID=UPI0030C23E47
MSFQLTKGIITSLCGRISSDRGKAYYRARKVTFTRCDPEASVYEATVKAASSSYQVAIEFHPNGDVEAECSCPSLGSYDQYCQHIAAVLHGIQDMERNELLQSYSQAARRRSEALAGAYGDPSPQLAPRSSTAAGQPTRIAAADVQLANRVLGLFGERPTRPNHVRPLFDTRTALDVSFTLKPVAYGFRKQMFGIELKVGPKRLYIVQKIREFLERIERGESFVFSKHFTYDPKHHRFGAEDDAVIRQLIHIFHNEKLYRETVSAHLAQTRSVSGERMLFIPPVSWEALLRLLAAAPNVQVMVGEKTFSGVHLSDELMPLRFAFDQADAEGYQMDVQGLEDITVMESYGIVVSAGKLIKLPDDQCKRLAELKQMLEASRKRQIMIPEAQMEPFMVTVVPGLMKLGSVNIARSVSDRIIQTQLKAKLYLDRVKDRLLAGLEFQYGDIVINPLEGDGQQRGSDRILMRDGEQERRILELMEQSPFTRTEGGYFMEDEDGQYEFLYHVVPELEKLLTVYATSAVKMRLHTGYTPPKVTVNLDERTNWLEFTFEIDGIPESHIRQLLQSVEEKRRYYRMPDGAFVPLENEAFQEIGRLIDDMGIRIAELKGADFRFPVTRGLHFIDSPRQGNAVKLGKSFRQLLENMRNPDNLDFPVPDSLASVLRDYQKYGFQWLKTLAHYRFGGILADDMGLGKTLQSIAFLVSVLPEIRGRRQPALIVSPASLMYNWKNELKKFAPDIQTVIADGSKTERGAALRDASEADVIITSYPLLRRDIELYAKKSFHTLILDEAQAFKNHATQTAQAVKELQAQYRFALTGTPVENSLEELWSIFDAVFPGLLPRRRIFNEMSREAVAKRVRPFLLRRVKADVLKELPEKIESLQASELLPEQKKLYVGYLSKLQHETLKHLNEETFDKNRIKILAGLTRLRQLCCHPALFIEDYAGSSAKFEQLLEIVADCRSAGRRLLVFSQFTEMLGLIGRELGYQGVPFFYLDGKTPAAERIELCNRFNEGERDLFLISLKAGGTGLNLTGADTVILYDLWWNPAVEEQASGRAHRIGQKKVVQVIRLVAQGTVEEKMYALQQKKKHLIEEVIKPGAEALSSLTEQDIREILMIE